MPFPVLRRMHGYVGETEVKCLHAWGKSFCVNSKHKKKNLLSFNKLSSTVWPPDISLFPESLQKTWGRGWSRRYLRYFTTVLRYTKRRSAGFGFCSVGGTGGTTSRCQLHVVEPRAQQWASTGKLWRRWLHNVRYIGARRMSVHTSLTRANCCCWTSSIYRILLTALLQWWVIFRLSNPAATTTLLKFDVISRTGISF